MWRGLVLCLILCIALAACSTPSNQADTEKASKKKEEPLDIEPVDLGDPTQPTEVRALKEANKIKEQKDQELKENQEILDARD